MTVDRRTLLVTSASFATALGLPFGGASNSGGISAETKRIRHDARSTEGKTMLRLYAEAVRKMREASVTGTPMDWTFQWYTHAVSATTTKQAEINRLFPDSADPNRVLAALTWDTCEAHRPGTRLPNFLPWHRAYVLVFEEIARRACGDNSFTLPYWDYTTDAVLPDEFMKDGDPEFGVLYVDRRHPKVNEGVAIDKHADVWRPELLNLDALKERTYLPDPSGAPAGFNAKLDGELHGFVHVNVGTTANMGRVPNAAYDPVFWLHHCNIDRLWAAWNSYGHANPTAETWKIGTHVFADADGNRRSFKNGDLTDTEALGYRYDKLPPNPAPETSVVVAAGPEAAVPAALAASRVVAEQKERIELGAGPVAVKLTTTPTATSAGSPFSPQAAAPGKRRYLVISNIATNMQPGVLYDVLARGVTAADGAPAKDEYVGSISFFDAPESGGAAPERSFVFDLTDKLRGKGPIDMTALVFVPAGKPVADARPIVGEVKLIER